MSSNNDFSISSLSLMTIREMIEAAFGDEDVFYVNFKLIETVLMVLAKQLNVLNRQVLIPNNISARLKDKAVVMVSEVKMVRDAAKKTPKSLSRIGNKTRSKSNKSSPETSISSTSSKDSSTYYDAHAKTFGKIVSNSDDDESMEDVVAQGKKKITSDSNSDVSKSKKYFEGIIGKIEEQKEKVLRIIHQRADSHEEGVVSPTPIASLVSTDIIYEKLFIVEKVTPEEAEKFSKSAHRQRQPSQLYVVPRDEFLKLAQAVADLQSLFRKYEAPEFPSNTQLMQDIRNNKPSLTDAMSLLQMSARLEACEKAMKLMIGMLTELAKGPVYENKIPAANIQQSFEEFINQLEKNPNLQKSGPGVTEPDKTALRQTFFESVRPPEQVMASPELPIDIVTVEQLKNSLQQLRDDIENTFGSAINRAKSNLTNAIKIGKRAEEKTEQALRLEPEIRKLRLEVKNCTELVNDLDAVLSSQITNYQEQFAQMENDLEAGLENMQDTLAIRGGDAEAMSELHAQFANLKTDFDNTKTAQKELEQILAEMSLDFLRLRTDVETLRDTKSDRDEVVDALRDKAGIKDLNGMIDDKLFRAVIGDLENRIKDFYTRAHAQELVWQKIIDDFTHQISMKAGLIDLVSLRDDINKHLEILRKKLHSISDILGEPNAAALTRKLQRDFVCLICGTPAVMSPEEPRLLPALPALRPTPKDTKLKEPKTGGDGDHETCYSGQPIPHQKKDSRFELCNRYCGGEHTKASYVRTQVPQELNLKSMNREVGLTLGTDGKIYQVDQELPLMPCLPCNTAKSSKNTIPAKELKLATESSDSFTVPSDVNALRASGWYSRTSYKDVSEILTPENTGKTCSITMHDSITAEPHVEVSSKDSLDGAPPTFTVSSGLIMTTRMSSESEPIDVAKDVEQPVTLGEVNRNIEDQSIIKPASTERIFLNKTDFNKM